MPSRSTTDTAEAKGELRRLVLGTHVHADASIARALQRAGGAQIHGIGIGRKIEGGKRTRKRAVRVYVTQKLPKGRLSPAALIPQHLDGIPTDVIEAPLAYLALPPRPQCSLDKMQRQRPVRGGISAAADSLLAGTIAAICRSTRPGEQGMKFLLSNHHVLAQLDAAAAGAILQPSPQDGGLAMDAVASLHRHVAIQPEPQGNRVDAAIALIAAGVDTSTDICSIPLVAGSATPTDGEAVHKHGRTTGYTSGTIDDISIDVRVPLEHGGAGDFALFEDQVRMIPRAGASLFAGFGDSGSLVVSKSSSMAVGLLFACPANGSFAYANPIDAVLQALDIELG